MSDDEFTDTTVFPTHLSANGWDGEGALEANLGATARTWSMREPQRTVSKFLAAAPLADPTNWRDENVGWGVVLPYNPALSAADLATAKDIPALATLIDARPNAPVFRFCADLPLTHIRRYFADGTAKDLSIASSTGIAPDRIPAYLLIVADPVAVPWRFQSTLSSRCSVGRVALDDAALDNYARHVVDEWKDSPVTRKNSLVWAVDWGSTDITRLMRRAITDPLVAAIGNDPDPNIANGVRYLCGDEVAASAATVPALCGALKSTNPGLVVTSSHGAAFPSNDPATMRENLGRLVGQERQVLDAATLLAGWEPDGAIWYAHACCAAGGSDLSEFLELVAGNPKIEAEIQAVSALGSTVAELPRALLSAKKPARAFVGHVEPTFDWTLREPGTGQLLGQSIVEGLYTRMYQEKPLPIGFALKPWYDGADGLLAAWDAAIGDAKRGVVSPSLLSTRLGARDRRSQVIFGDPTVVPAP